MRVLGVELIAGALAAADDAGEAFCGIGDAIVMRPTLPCMRLLSEATASASAAASWLLKRREPP